MAIKKQSGFLFLTAFLLMACTVIYGQKETTSSKGNC
jgi:hypothetical protein